MDIITLALCKRMGKSKADIDGVYPNLIAGGVVESEVRDEDFSNKITEHTGTAYIKSIKGNTLVWNQLIQNGNFADGTNHWGFVRGTISATNNVLTYEVTEVGSSNSANRFSQVMSLIAGHKYLFFGEFMGSKDGIKITVTKEVTSQYFIATTTLTTANTWYKLSGIAELITNGENIAVRYANVASVGEVGDKIYAKNIMLIDLTQMGLDITDPSDFTSLFPLSYYAYNQGTLLSFMGNGIKTVGKNLLPLDIMGNKSGIVYTYNNDGTISLRGTATSTITDRSPFTSASVATLKKNVAYRVSGCPSGGSANTYKLQVWNSTDNQAINTDYGYGATFTLPEDKSVAIRFVIYSGQNMDGKVIKPMITFADADQTYEPYTESTLSLPISSYFPTGMKSAGTAYDELTPSKAITRIGMVDLGSLDWRVNPNVNGGFNCRVADMKLGVSGQMSSVICPLYETINTKYYGIMNTMQNMQIAQSNATQGELYLINTSYNDATAFKTAMSGVYLYYELATETEVDVNLDLSYKTYEGGAEQLLPENGSVPVTSPMKTNVEFAFDENINALLDKMLNMIAPVETSPTSNAYSIGQYLIYDYVLYKVTSAIASGGNITVGTNVEATTIASVLESL